MSSITRKNMKKYRHNKSDKMCAEMFDRSPLQSEVITIQTSKRT